MPRFGVQIAVPVNAFSADFAGVAGGTGVRLFKNEGDTPLAKVAGQR